MFDPNSRYIALVPYNVPDTRERTVAVVPPAPAPPQTLLGIHVLRQGQRLDHLAALYTTDPAGYWRIAEQNEVMLAEALTEAPEIQIPMKTT
jgi:hypothetical protein